MDLLTVDSPQETIFLFHALWTFQSVDCGGVFSAEAVAAKWWLGVTPSCDNLWVGLNLKWPTWSVTPSWHISGDGIVTSTFLGMLSYFGKRFWAQYSAIAKGKRGLVTILGKFRASKTYLLKLLTLLIWLLLRWQSFFLHWTQFDSPCFVLCEALVLHKCQGFYDLSNLDSTHKCDFQAELNCPMNNLYPL